MSIIKVYKNKLNFKYQNRNDTRNSTYDNFIPTIPNTTLMQNLYVNRGIKLFNKLSCNINIFKNYVRFKSERKTICNYCIESLTKLLLDLLFNFFF